MPQIHPPRLLKTVSRQVKWGYLSARDNFHMGELGRTSWRASRRRWQLEGQEEKLKQVRLDERKDTRVEPCDQRQEAWKEEGRKWEEGPGELPALEAKKATKVTSQELQAINTALCCVFCLQKIGRDQVSGLLV